MKKLKIALSLLWTLFKIGLFTFGGGYAMVAMFERELVENKKWLKKEEFIDIIAIAESTPGPIAVNTATYVGYKRCGVLGSIFATLGVVLPSFIIIFIISLFFDKFLQLKWVQYAFKGIQASVVFLILSAGFNMLKAIKKNAINVIVLVSTVACLVAFSIFSISFSSIFYILIGGVIGLIVYFIDIIKNHKKNKQVENQNQKGEDK